MSRRYIASLFRGLGKIQKKEKVKGRKRSVNRARFEQLEDRRLLAAYVVNSTAYSGPGTLLAAITAANAANDTAANISFNLPANSTIQLAAANFDSAASAYGPTAYYVHGGSGTNITIDGSGASGLTIDGGSALRPFLVSSGNSLTLENLTIQNGLAAGGNGGNGAVGGGGGAGLGGAIWNEGTLNLVNGTFTENRAIGGNPGTSSGINRNGGGGGGGLGSAGAANSSVIGGKGGGTNGGAGATGAVGGSAGGIGGGGGGGSLTGSITLVGTAGGNGGFGGGAGGGGKGTNRTGASGTPGFGGGAAGIGGSAFGGAVFNNGGAVAITNSTLATNSSVAGTGGASEGAAVFTNGGTLTITSSTVSGNTAGSAAGTGLAAGAGVAANSGSISITNSTIAGNTVLAATSTNALGGGIYALGGTVTLLNDTLSLNTAAGGGRDFFNAGAVATVNNSILAQADTAVTDLVGQVTQSNFATGLNFPIGLVENNGTIFVSNYATGSGTTGFISKVTASGVVSQFVTGLNSPVGMAMDTAGNLYVSQNNLGNIAKITPSGTITTFASGFQNPSELVFDSSGNLYVANYFAGLVNKVSPSGVVSTLISGLNQPRGLAYSNGNLYVSVGGDNTVRKFNLSTQTMTTIATNISNAHGIAVDSAGNVFVSGLGTTTLSKITPTGSISAYATIPTGCRQMAFDANGSLYIASNGTNSILKIVSGQITGDGNVIGSSSGFIGTVVSSADPLLGPLANNGGPTQTMALQAGSPAIDVGSDAAASGLTTDQRGSGFARLVGNHVDIGAFEVQATLSSIAITPSSPTLNAVGATQQFTATGTFSDSTTQNLTSTVTWSSSATSIATISASGLAKAVANGSTNITASLNGVTSNSVSLSVSATQTPTVVVKVPTNAVYTGSAPTITATVTSPGGTVINPPVSFTYYSGDQSALTPAQLALLTPLSSPPFNARTFTVVASSSAITGFAAATSAPKAYTIAKANATINVTGYDVTYDGNPHFASATVTGVQGETLFGIGLKFTGHTKAGTYTDPWDFFDGTGNYNDASGSVTDKIAKANATINVTGYNVTFDGNPHTATATIVGVNGESLAGLNLSGTTHTIAGLYTDTWNFIDVTGNYNDGSGSVTNTITAVSTIAVTLSPATASLAENSNTSSATALSTIAVSGSESYTLTLSGTDAASFEIVGNALQLKAGVTLNFETKSSYSVRVNVDDPTVSGSTDAYADFTLNVTDVLELSGIDVQNGQTQRSYVRNVDILFDSANGLNSLLSGNRIQLTRYDLNGINGAVISLPSTAAVGNSIKLDFGAQGIGGNRGTNAGDGYYEIAVDMDGNGSFETKKYFHRLLGDVNGNGIVDGTDKGLILAAQGVSSSPEFDVNGDGFVNATDTNLVSRAVGRKLKDGLWRDD